MKEVVRLADFKISPEVLQNASNDFSHIQSRFSQYSDEIQSIARGLPFKVSAREALKSKLLTSANNADSLSNKAKSLSTAAVHISEKYRATENRISTKKSTANNSSIASASIINDSRFKNLFTIVGPDGRLQDFSGFGNSLDGLKKILSKILPNITTGDYNNLANDLMKWYNGLGWGNQQLVRILTGSGIFGGLVSSMMSGISVKGDLDFLAGDVKTSAKADWNLTKGDAKAKASVSAEGHGISASGEVGGQYGKIEGEVNVGNVEAKGEVGATLFDDGEFSPQLYAKGEISGNVAEGEIKGTLGTDEYNAHAKAEGEVLSAKASAEGAIGKIVDKDDNGNVSISYGVKGEVGASAYAAEGKVSGGITIFGVDIDVSAKGQAGGASAKAGGSVTTGGMSGTAGIGLGLGAEVSISVDWSDFKWPWEEFQWPWEH